MNKKMTPSKLQELLWSFAGHRVLTVAGRTGILNALSEKAQSINEIAKKLTLDKLATGKIIRSLCAIGIVECSTDKYFIAKDLKDIFLKGENDLTPFLEHSHNMYDRWGENLEGWLKGETWKTQKRSLQEIEQFSAAMKAMSSHVSLQVVSAINLDGVKNMLDVGGGTGGYSQAFCKKNKLINATVFETPKVAKLGTQKLKGTTFEKQIKFLGGNYLNDDLGGTFDLILIANVIHQESPASAKLLIKRCSDALAKGGKLLIVDFAIDEKQQEHLTGTLFAINMRSFGDTYPQHIIEDWFDSAGLGNFEKIDLEFTRWILMAQKL